MLIYEITDCFIGLRREKELIIDKKENNMSTLKQRIFDAAKEFELINFATVTEDGKPWVRFVVGKADNELVFRFCTHLETKKVGQIRKNPNVHLSMGATDFGDG